MGRQGKGAAMGDVRGVMYVEFLVVFFPLFFLWLGMLQLSLFSIAQLVVQHAATVACRAAIVVIDDDPQYYDGAERGKLLDEGDPKPSLLSRVRDVAVSLGRDDDEELPDPTYRAPGARLSEVRNAAYLPLMAIAPEPSQLSSAFQAGVGSLLGGSGGEGLSMHGAIGDHPWTRATTGWLYDEAFAAVTFPKEPGSEEFKTEVAPNEEVTIRVTYLFHCAVPFMATFLCKPYAELAGIANTDFYRVAIGELKGGVDAGTIQRLREKKNEADAEAEHDRPIAIDLQEVEDPGLQLVALGGGRFRALRAEATLPNQAAPYKYQSEVQSSSGQGGGTP